MRFVVLPPCVAMRSYAPPAFRGPTIRVAVRNGRVATRAELGAINRGERTVRRRTKHLAAARCGTTLLLGVKVRSVYIYLLTCTK